MGWPLRLPKELAVSAGEKPLVNERVQNCPAGSLIEITQDGSLLQGERAGL
jgi:hypothetical protein